VDPSLGALIGLITGGGPYVLAAVFAFLWWSEREERRAGQATIASLLERTLKALSDTANAIGDLRVVLGMHRNDQGRGG
jgi:hypothetical protein